jgi:dolichyl-diphosphooligosaccharide--protein glycosyltransferase
MTDVREAAASLVEERPETRNALRTLLAADEDGTWEFEEVDVDSGTFGEIVSRGIVERRGDSYTLADRRAVRAALDGDEPAGDADLLPSLGLSVGHRNSALVLTLCGVLVLAFAVRTVPMVDDVLRGKTVLLAGNDPYLYWYWGRELLATGPPAFDVRGLQSLPGGLAVHDVLMVVFVWWTAASIGGGGDAVARVLAWYPPVAALITVVGAYLVAERLTDDRRVGIAAALLLAVTPSHAYRTALGFGDHHALEYVWITLAVVPLVALALGRTTAADDSRDGTAGERVDRRPARPVVAALLLAVGVAGSALNWRGGPFFLFPVAFYVFLEAVSAVRTDTSPLRRNRYLLAGLAGATALTLVGHLGLGWVEPFRGFAPALLLAGSGVVLGTAEVAHRLDLSTRVTAGAGVGGTVLFAAFAWFFVPDVQRATGQLIEYMTASGSSGIAETYSLFSGQLGTIVGPLFEFGLVFVLAFPYAGWATWKCWRRDRPGWLVPVAFFWYFLVLSTVQLRFTAPLALVTAPFAGLGFVHLAAAVDVAAPPRPFADGPGRDQSIDGTLRGDWRSLASVDRGTLATLVVLFLLVGSLGFLQTGIKMQQIAVEDSTYETGAAIDAYAERQGLAYPENYVLSSWGRNRAYNYLVNGESESYGYARRTYGAFLTSTSPDEWTTRLRERPVGFVLTTDRDLPRRAIGTRLHDHHGSRVEGVPGLAHYRLVSVAGGGSKKAFAVVPGANVTGSAPANSTVRLSTEVSVDGTTFTYRREVAVGSDGSYAVRVPYPGEYSVGNRTVTVSEEAVVEGRDAGSNG